MMSASEHGEPMTPLAPQNQGRIGALAVTCVATLGLGSLVATPAVADPTGTGW